MKKKHRKSTWLSLILLVYVTAMAIYFLPGNGQMSNTEKYVTFAASYIIVIALWFVLRKKEQYKERREADIQNKYLKGSEE